MKNKITILSVLTAIIGIVLFSQTTLGQGLVGKFNLVNLNLTNLTPAEIQVAHNHNIDNISVTNGTLTIDGTNYQYHAYKEGVINTDFYLPISHDVINISASQNATAQAKLDYLNSVNGNLTTQTQKIYDSINITITEKVNYTQSELDQLEDSTIQNLIQSSINYYNDNGNSALSNKIIGNNKLYSTGLGGRA